MPKKQGNLPKPPFGSEWIAKDGRKMTVVGYTETDVFGRASALMEVANARGATRRTTRQALENFGTFLKPVEGTNE